MTPPKAYINLFAVPENGLPEYKRQFYSFDYGPVHFTVLDTNFHEAQGWQPQLLTDELRWLEQDLANSKARWKIVLQHRDIFMYAFSKASGRPERATFFLDFSRQLMPLYEKYGVGMFAKLDAEYAMVIYDAKEGTWIASRDPIGIRPLFYGYTKNHRICFGSTAESLMPIAEDIMPFPPGTYYKDGVFTAYTHIELPDTVIHDDLETVCKGISDRIFAAAWTRFAKK